MNIPSINPQLRNIISGAVVDYVFVIRDIRDSEFDYKNPNGIARGGDIADVECYIDDEWNQEETMKGMSIENARAWWHKLVHNGYERVLTP
jgi:hypothetical protein